MAFGMSTFMLIKFDITGLAKPYSATEKTMNTWNISVSDKKQGLR